MQYQRLWNILHKDLSENDMLSIWAQVKDILVVWRLVEEFDSFHSGNCSYMWEIPPM